MCQRITCRECGKPSFAGCGRHVESVLGDVPRAKRCPGHAPKAASEGKGQSPSAIGKLFDFLTGSGDRRGS
jgi:hypothetical protein